MKPAHFLKQFHPDYDGESYEELELKDKWWETPGYPTIFAWYCQEVTPGEKNTFVRNPYYWKTDTDGNQLPYIDYVEIDIQPDVEVRVLNLSQGKYNASFRGTDDPNNIPFLQEQSEANGYHLQAGWMNGAGGWPSYMINQDYDGEECKGEKEECRDLLRDKNFRKGLSVAIDRQRVIDVVWDGLAEPTQATISPQSWHFASDEGKAIYEEWKNADIEYDPAEAEAYFDAAGFVDCDDDGWRDLPETCNPFTLIIDMNDWGGENVNVETNELVKEMWNDVGVDVLVNNLIGQPDADTRGNYGLYMIRNTHISEIDLWTYPDWVFPMRRRRRLARLPIGRAVLLLRWRRGHPA
jgi:peptide/nickel transport system substrate-binding protein